MKKRASFTMYRIATAMAAVQVMLMLLPLVCIAQSPLRLQHISVREGLSQNSVNCIVQDKYGFIWLATGDGLNRYDGKEVIVHKSRFTDLSSTLSDRNINSKLVEDDRNRLWMATDGGISFRDYRHAMHQVAVGDRIGSGVMLGMHNEIVWAAAPRRGVVALNTRDLTSKLYAFDDKHQMDPAHVYPIHSAALTKEGIWIVDEKGLLFFNINTHKDQRIKARDKLYGVCLLRNNKLLLTTNDGAFIYDTHSRKETFLPVTVGPKPATQEWWHCVEDPKTGIVFLGGNGGFVAALDVESGHYDLHNFQSTRVNCLYIDHSQNLWVGTEGDGAYKLDIKPAKFKSFSPFDPKEATNGFMVKSIYEGSDNRIWIGTVDKGLWVYDPRDQRARNVELPVPLFGKQVGAIIRDSAGSVVVAAAHMILWLDEQTCKIKRQISLPAVNSSSSEMPVVNCMTEWKKGHYLVGTNLAMFSVDAEGSDIKARLPLSVHNAEWGGWIYGFYKLADGTVMIGKRNGFTRLRVINDTSLELLDKGLYKFVIRHFYKSNNTPILWIASEVGLVAYNERTKSMQAFDEHSGLGNSHLYSVLPENDSVLWISTNKGISRVAVHYGDIAHIKTEVTNYNSTDGLQSDEFNTGAYYRSGNGTLIFGGINGINWFDPKDIRTNPYKATPSVAALYVNDSLFAGDTAHFIRALTLPYNKNTISFNLRALEFTQPEENMFAYTLEGLEFDWVYSKDGKARYSNLPPGSYTFLVKTRNNEGLWNEQPFRMDITILPPYWKTWWFRLSAILLALGITAVIIAYFIKQKVRAKTLQLERQQALNMERLRISKDVHDDLGAGLSKIAMMAEMAQKQVVDDMTIGKDIRHISSVSKDLIDNMHDLIWVLNPENTTLDNLVARIREYSADYLDGLNIEACLKFPDHVPEVSITREAQRNIFSTVKEAVNNCIKHSKASKINIDLSLEHGMFAIKIADNGTGITGSKPRQGNGLRNMKQRIESIGGDFSISSETGTAVYITLPMTSLTNQ